MLVARIRPLRSTMSARCAMIGHRRPARAASGFGAGQHAHPHADDREGAEEHDPQHQQTPFGAGARAVAHLPRAGGGGSRARSRRGSRLSGGRRGCAQAGAAGCGSCLLVSLPDGRRRIGVGDRHRLGRRRIGDLVDDAELVRDQRQQMQLGRSSDWPVPAAGRGGSDRPIRRAAPRGVRARRRSRAAAARISRIAVLGLVVFVVGPEGERRSPPERGEHIEASISSAFLSLVSIRQSASRARRSPRPAHRCAARPAAWPSARADSLPAPRGRARPPCG